MKVAALVSGGKDSMLALHLASEEHEIACLVNISSTNPDSYMFHTVNSHILDYISAAMDLPLVRGHTAGEKESELLDLERTIRILKVEGLVVGGVASNYQKERFEKLCNSLNLKLVSPLWGMDEEDIMNEVITKFHAIIVRVSAMGFDETWLGRTLDFKALEELMALKERYGINITGEGGEYESLVLDAPLYRKRLEIIEGEKKFDGMSGIFEVKRVKLVDKVDL